MQKENQLTASSHFRSVEQQSCHRLTHNSSLCSFKSRTLKMSRTNSNQDLLRETLKAGRRTNNILKDLSNEESVLTKRPELVQSILKLKDMKLLRQKNLQITRYCQVVTPPVYNDYHSRQTNPGYSRNKLGYFFTK